MKIGDRAIGPGHPVYIIAELGVNHDGSVDRALELTDAAAEAGADAIKLQFFKTDLLMSKAAKLAAYQKAAGESDPITMLRRLQLPIRDMARVVDRAHAKRLHAIVTVFSVELVPEAETLAWDAYKTASPDLINKPLLDALAATGKPLIVSTGASTLAEVERTIDWLRGAHDRLALLQCVSAYPAPPEQHGLGGIIALRNVFPGPVGYSDHIDDDRSGLIAESCGATVLEKHITYDRDAPGPDHAASLDAALFRQYVAKVRDREAADREFATFVRLRDDAVGAYMARETDRLRGEFQSRQPATKEVLPVEQDVRAVSRQCLVTRRVLPAGHRLAREDLTIKRPGTGIEPWRFDEVIGRQTRRAVEADVPLTDEDLV